MINIIINCIKGISITVKIYATKIVIELLIIHQNDFKESVIDDVIVFI